MLPELATSDVCIKLALFSKVKLPELTVKAPFNVTLNPDGIVTIALSFTVNVQAFIFADKL